MKNGNCPMCKSNEVYMTENDKSRGSNIDEVAFSAGRVEARMSITTLILMYA